MKLITAIIRPEHLDVVREALLQADIDRITVSRCTGHGQASSETELYRGKKITPDLIAKTKIDIVVNDVFVKPAVDAIVSAARTGMVGDGKIIVSPIDEVYRIRTGESGGEAV